MALLGAQPELVRVTTATTGTSDVVLGSAVPPFMGKAQLVNGLIYRYTIFDVNGMDSEVGYGAYTSGSSTLARSTIIRSVIAGTEGTTKLALSATGSTVIIGPSGLAEQSDYAQQRGFIRGGVLDDATNTTISCTPIAAFIESANQVYDFAAPANLTITVGASALGHVYLKTDGTIVDSTTAPVLFASPAGNARSKSGDPTQRYLGSFATDSSSHILPFTMTELGSGFASMAFTLAGNGVAPYRFVTAGANTAYGSVSSFNAAASIIPANVPMEALMQITQTQLGTSLLFLSTDGVNDNACEYFTASTSGFSGFTLWSPVAPATPGIFYRTSVAGATVFFDVTSYKFVR